MTITYTGSNIGLEYDAATATWGLNNTPTEYVDTEAFSSTDPDFVYNPPTTDSSTEEEDDFNPCPVGYVYDNELKQCVPDTNYQNPFMQPDKTYQKDDYAYAVTDPNNKSTNPFGIWVPPVQNIDGTWEAGYTKQMPNTMDKFTQEQLIDWGKSKGYITKNGTIVGAMQASDKLGMYKGIGQFLNDRQYNNWLKRIENKGMAKSESGHAGKVVVVVGQQFDSYMQKKLDAFKTVANNSIVNYNRGVEEIERQILEGLDTQDLEQIKERDKIILELEKLQAEKDEKRAKAEREEIATQKAKDDYKKTRQTISPVKDKGYQSQTRGRKSTPVKSSGYQSQTRGRKSTPVTKTPVKKAETKKGTGSSGPPGRNYPTKSKNTFKGK